MYLLRGAERARTHTERETLPGPSAGLCFLYAGGSGGLYKLPAPKRGTRLAVHLTGARSGAPFLVASASNKFFWRRGGDRLRGTCDRYPRPYQLDTYRAGVARSCPRSPSEFSGLSPLRFPNSEQNIYTRPRERGPGSGLLLPAGRALPNGSARA